MIHRSVKGRGGRRWARRGVLLCGGLLASLAAGLSATGNGGPDYAAYIAAAGGVRSATTASSTGAATVTAIPAFARKYGLRCSACHTAWPELNVFGQRVQGRRLPAGQRPRLTDLDQPRLLADCGPHHAAVAFREHHQPAGGRSAGRAPYREDGHSVRLRHQRRRPPDDGHALQEHHLRIRSHPGERGRGRHRGRLRPVRQPVQVVAGST